MTSTLQENFVKRAIQVSRESVTHGNQSFGAILVDSEGHELLSAENTELTYGFLGHAEMNLMRKVIENNIPEEKLKSCTIYTSTEPCLMCTGAIFRSKVGNVVYACSSERMSEIINSGKILTGTKKSFKDLVTSYQRNINIIGPILEDEASEVHVQFQALRKKQ